MIWAQSAHNRKNKQILPNICPFSKSFHLRRAFSNNFRLYKVIFKKKNSPAAAFVLFLVKFDYIRDIFK